MKFPLSPAQTLFSASLAALVLFGLSGCGSTGAGSASDKLSIGFIYIGPKDDYGYSQAHAQGAAAVKKLDGVSCLEQEKVPETSAVQEAMEDMIETDGAKVIFASSFGYFDPHVLILAKKYPSVTFLHCGGLWTEGKHPLNVHSYFGYIDEAQYLSGIIAGQATKSNKLGFVAAKPIPQVRRNINAFLLGARSVNPEVTCTVIFTGDWSLPTKEAEATTSLIDQGADVITCHVDSPKVVIETAERRGVYTCGYHASQAKLAPKGYLTGAEWNWEKVYVDFIKDIKAGKKLPNLVRGGLKEGIVRTSPYGPAVKDEWKKKADDVKAKFMDGSFVIFKGPLKDNTGKVVIPAGKSYGQTAIELESMGYLVEGVISKD